MGEQSIKQMLLVALAQRRNYVRPTEVKGLWGLSAGAASDYVRDFKKEVERVDSKFPEGAYLYHSKRASWLHIKVLEYFMCCYPELTDEVARKDVESYKEWLKRKENELG